MELQPAERETRGGPWVGKTNAEKRQKHRKMASHKNGKIFHGLFLRWLVGCVFPERMGSSSRYGLDDLQKNVQRIGKSMG